MCIHENAFILLFWFEFNRGRVYLFGTLILSPKCDINLNSNQDSKRVKNKV